jgi:hypothetical protein
MNCSYLDPTYVSLLRCIVVLSTPNYCLDVHVNCPQAVVDYFSFCFYCIFGYCRHPDDEFDRYWFPIQGSNSTFIQSTSPLQSLVASKIVGFTEQLYGEPPATVTDTALTSSGNITITFPDDYSYQYILSFYYAELNSTANASSRNFYLEVPGGYYGSVLLNPYSNHSNVLFSPVEVRYWELPYTPGTDIVLLYPDQSVSSPLGPIANALETWEISTNLMATMTNNQDGELNDKQSGL